MQGILVCALVLVTVWLPTSAATCVALPGNEPAYPALAAVDTASGQLTMMFKLSRYYDTISMAFSSATTPANCNFAFTVIRSSAGTPGNPVTLSTTPSGSISSGFNFTYGTPDSGCDKDQYIWTMNYDQALLNCFPAATSASDIQTFITPINITTTQALTFESDPAEQTQTRIGSTVVDVEYTFNQLVTATVTGFQLTSPQYVTITQSTLNPVAGTITVLIATRIAYPDYLEVPASNFVTVGPGFTSTHVLTETTSSPCMTNQSLCVQTFQLVLNLDRTAFPCATVTQLQALSALQGGFSIDFDEGCTNPASSSPCANTVDIPIFVANLTSDNTCGTLATSTDISLPVSTTLAGWSEAGYVNAVSTAQWSTTTYFKAYISSYTNQMTLHSGTIKQITFTISGAAGGNVASTYTYDSPATGLTWGTIPTAHSSYPNYDSSNPFNFSVVWNANNLGLSSFTGDYNGAFLRIDIVLNFLSGLNVHEVLLSLPMAQTDAAVPTSHLQNAVALLNAGKNKQSGKAISLQQVGGPTTGTTIVSMSGTPKAMTMATHPAQTTVIIVGSVAGGLGLALFVVISIMLIKGASSTTGLASATAAAMAVADGGSASSAILNINNHASDVFTASTAADELEPVAHCHISVV